MSLTSSLVTALYMWILLGVSTSYWLPPHMSLMELPCLQNAYEKCCNAISLNITAAVATVAHYTHALFTKFAKFGNPHNLMLYELCVHDPDFLLLHCTLCVY